MPRTSYVQIKGKLREVRSDGSCDVDGRTYIRAGFSWVDVDAIYGTAGMVLGDIEPFISTVDGSTILGRAALREHNRKHGVTSVEDFKGQWARQAQERESYQRGELRDSSAREMIARETYRRI